MAGMGVDLVARQLAELHIYQNADSFVPIVRTQNVWPVEQIHHSPPEFNPFEHSAGMLNPGRVLQPPFFTGPPPFPSYENPSLEPARCQSRRGFHSPGSIVEEDSFQGVKEIGGLGLRRWSLGEDSGLEVNSTSSLRLSGLSCGGTSCFSLDQDINDGSEISVDSSCGYGGSDSGSVGNAKELSEVELDLYYAIRRTARVRVPPGDYICQLCYEKGHYIEQCPKKHSRRTSVHTPYQGSKLCYGTFDCLCGHRWGSYRSYREAQQACKKCHAQTYPKKQYDPTAVPAEVLHRYHGRGNRWVAVIGRYPGPNPLVAAA